MSSTCSRPRRILRLSPAAAVLTILACGGGDGAPAPGSGADPQAGRGAAAPWFEEQAAARGLDFEHASGADGRFLMPEIMTTGAALFDADGDGDLDAYLVQAGGVDTPREERPGNELFLNRGDGHFEPAPAGHGADDRGYGMGVATGDYDGDGDVDLYVSNLTRNALLRNDGTGRFEDVTEAANADVPAWSASAAFLDADGDGDLDLFVTNYIEWSTDGEKVCLSPQKARTYCSPKSYDRPARDTLLLNRGDGTFEDASEASGLDAAFGNGLGVVCADFDLDGAPEIFVANDGNPNQYWDPADDGRFVDGALRLGCAVDTQGRSKAGMGVAAADVDGDGDEDLLVVNLTGESDSFYRNDAGQFVDRTPAVGLAVVSRRRTRFGVALRDFDLDGTLDLYHANGRVTGPPRAKEGDPFAEENVLLRGLENGRFEEVQPRGGVASPLEATSRAAAFGDIDGDGDVDALIHNRDGRAHLLVNRAPAPDARWAVLDVVDGKGAPALGAAVLVTIDGATRRFEVRTADSYCAASSPRVHVALPGGAKLEKVEVRRAGAAPTVVRDLAAGEVHRIVIER